MKLTLDALKERAGAVASEELLLTISGGTENACHDDSSSSSSSSSSWLADLVNGWYEIRSHN